jgi:uncharacterized protein (TIGR03437 family)
MFKTIRGIAVSFLVFVLHGQQLPYPTYLHPSSLFVGSGSSTVELDNSYSAGLTALWNGSPRPTLFGANGSYTITLTASDLAAAQLAQITMVTAQGAVIDTVSLPVVYNVLPTGVAFDPRRNRVYIATPPQSTDPNFPANSVVALDVNSGNIGAFLFVGSALGDLALSDDATALYVVVEGKNVVRRVDPSTFTAVGDFNFRPAGTQPAGPTIDAIQVMPGKPDTVALGFSPYSSEPGLIIYDNGVPRVNGLAGYNGLLFSPDGQYMFQNGQAVYAQDQRNGEPLPSILRYTIDSTGIPIQSPAYALGTGPAAVSNNMLYTSAGTAIVYASMMEPGSFGVGGPLAVDSTVQRAYILYTGPDFDDDGDGPPAELVAFDLTTLETLGSLRVGLASISTLNAPEQLIHFSTDGFILPSTSGLLIFHTPLAGPSPVTAANAVVNAASQRGGSIAPGEILTIYGTNLGPAIPQAGVLNAGIFPSLLANTQVWFNQWPGTLLLSDQGQVNVVAPFELEPGSSVNLQIWYYGNPSLQIALPVVPAAPALFTQDGSGSGSVAVINQDGSVDTSAPAGTVVELYGTGGGMAGSSPDGAIAMVASNLAVIPSVTIGGQNARVLYAGAAPGLVNGVFQMNVQIPNSVSSGAAPIVVTSGGQSSLQGATLAIR